MTHEDRGHYARKHPPETTLDPVVGDALRSRLRNGRIACAAAHAAAAELGKAPADMGVAIDLLEARIEKCQLGLFGHGPGKTALDDDRPTDPAVASALSAAAENGRVTCARCWRIAAEADVPRRRVGAACEKLGLKIKKCQLGAF